MAAASAQTSESRDAAQQMRERADAVLETLAGINELSARLSNALDRAAIAQLVVEDARKMVHADRASLVVPAGDGKHLELIGHAGLPPGVADELKLLPIDGPLGLAEVFRTGKPILTFKEGAYYERFPNAASKNWDKPVASMAAIPLMQGAETIGAVAFSFSTVVPLDSALEAFLTDVARHTASALERARLYEAERSARREAEAAMARTRLLADASRLFAEKQHDLRSLLDAVCSTLIEKAADSCAILLVTADGYLDPAAVRHKDGSVTQDILRILAENRVKKGETLLGQVVTSGNPVLLPKVDPTRLPSYANPNYRTFHERYPLTSMIIAPMRVGGRSIGVLNLGRYGDSTSYTEADLTLAMELADRAALAVSATLALEAERTARENSERVQQHLERLNELTTEVSRAATPEEVARAVVKRSHQLLDASTTVLVYADDSNSTLRLLDQSGLPEKTAHDLQVFPQDSKTPVAESFRTSRPVILRTREEIFTAFPELSVAPEHRERLSAIICWPLVAGPKALGAIGYSFHAPVKIDGDFERFVRDLARQSALALERAALYDAAKAAVHAREEFLSVASHELRTPLTHLGLKLQTFGKELETNVDPNRLKDHVELMRRQLRKLTHLVNGLLDVTRINAGRLSLDRREVNIADLVREVVLRHEAEAAGAGCTLYMEVPERVLGDFDPMRVEQVTTNLLSNALKYGAGHPVRVSLTETARHIQLVVDDEGIGIDAQDVPRLFGRFERAKSGLSFAGLGLGLYITRQIVEAHGGLIRVESAPGKGSRFEVELPKSKA